MRYMNASLHFALPRLLPHHVKYAFPYLILLGRSFD
jgi:hypothetical protein